jgi:hypothetical protein
MSEVLSAPLDISAIKAVVKRLQSWPEGEGQESIAGLMEAAAKAMNVLIAQCEVLAHELGWMPAPEPELLAALREYLWGEMCRLEITDKADHPAARLFLRVEAAIEAVQ